MTERRAILGGLSLAIAGVPLVLYYGLSSFGYLGAAFSIIGILIAAAAAYVD